MQCNNHRVDAVVVVVVDWDNDNCEELWPFLFPVPIVSDLILPTAKPDVVVVLRAVAAAAAALAAVALYCSNLSLFAMIVAVVLLPTSCR